MGTCGLCFDTDGMGFTGVGMGFTGVASYGLCCTFVDTGGMDRLFDISGMGTYELCCNLGADGMGFTGICFS